MEVATKKKTRFNMNAKTVNQATLYLINRSKQLLRLGYTLTGVDKKEWGVIGYFMKNNKTYQSIYVLEQYRGSGFYMQHIRQRDFYWPILTSTDCNLVEFLEAKGINHVVEELTPYLEYEIISNYYLGDKTRRSKVYKMNHIDEGLHVLEQLNASDVAKKAYCLHPIVQGDEDLANNLHLLKDVDYEVIIAALEYRSVANEYLSTRVIKDLSEIRLSPLKDVNDMLIADKLQNYKDFILYHTEHPRFFALNEYFMNWHKKLGVETNAILKYTKLNE